MTITSSYNSERNIHTSIIPGYLDDMVILKGVIYEKEWPSGLKGYLTLIVMIPLGEFKECVSVTKNRPNTYGVFVMVIGSMTNIIPTTNRVNLNLYQHMIEDAGWRFKTTVPIKGMEYESARQLAFKAIQKIKRGGDKNKTEKVDKEKIQELIDSTIDEVMNRACKDAEAPSCESCDYYGKCVFLTVEEKLSEVKRMLGI